MVAPLPARRGPVGVTCLRGRARVRRAAGGRSRAVRDGGTRKIPLVRA